jgi:hypothetical protein
MLTFFTLIGAETTSDSMVGPCWPLTKLWEFLGHVDLFWDFDSLSKKKREKNWRSRDLGPILGPFWVFRIM